MREGGSVCVYIFPPQDSLVNGVSLAQSLVETVSNDMFDMIFLSHTHTFIHIKERSMSMSNCGM